MADSQITVRVQTDENKVPTAITWSADDSDVANQTAKAMSLAMWDEAQGNAVAHGPLDEAK